jgi:hypothetical protein
MKRCAAWVCAGPALLFTGCGDEPEVRELGEKSTMQARYLDQMDKWASREFTSVEAYQRSVNEEGPLAHRAQQLAVRWLRGRRQSHGGRRAGRGRAGGDPCAVRERCS